MFWLSLDLASAVGSVALHEKTDTALRRLEEREVSRGSNPLERFLPVLQELLQANHVEFPQITRLVTTSGPGSFTGLRVAYASLKGFAMALQIPVETLSGHEARALAWFAQHPEAAEVFVTTCVSRGSECLTHFSPTGDGKIRKISEAIVGEIQVAGTVLDEKFPLRAAYLAEGLERAASRRTHTTLLEWINCGPQYLGETKFKETTSAGA